ncbi:MAG: ribokinase [Rhodobacteraceae bacterium]|nr:ribokinase [Paracoccaceae bacterium]
MPIYSLGSINADHFYDLPHLPGPGETLAATGFRTGLGGKGANQSVAAAKAGAKVTHIGAVGPEGGWAVDRLRALGVETSGIATLETATGHAIINIDRAGENAIVIYPGANRGLSEAQIRETLANAGGSDTLILQNETNAQLEGARIARAKGMRVVYSAAPFEEAAVRAILPEISLLILNAVEADQLCTAFGCGLGALPVPELLVTKGAEGAEWHALRAGQTTHMPAFDVKPVDTTGAGDCFAGYFAAGLDEGLPVEAALRLASAAAALKVTRPGTADAIPDRAEVDGFLRSA